jgi:hypothetical protein
VVSADDTKLYFLSHRTVEFARQKCEQYWPVVSAGITEATKTFGNIRVKLNTKENEMPTPDYMIRTLRVDNLIRCILRSSER